MNLLNLQKLAEDYGPLAFIVIAIIVLIWLVWKVYPAVASFVSVINLIKSIPDRFATVNESNDRKEVALNDIKSTVGKHTEAIETTVETLRKHVEWSDKENTVLHRYIEAGDRQAAEWELIRDSWYDMTAKVNLLIQTANRIDAAQDTVIHEVKHNGGSSLKDATVRAESAVVQNNERLDSIERLLQNNERLDSIEKLLTDLINAKQT